MKYRPTFSITIRNNKYAIWVTRPDGDRQNIWDLKEHPSEDVQAAIQHAFALGAEFNRMLMAEFSIQPFPISEMSVEGG